MSPETLILSPVADTVSTEQRVTVGLSRPMLVDACEKGGPSPEELVLFFDQSADLLCIATFGGYFLHLNTRWSEVLGYSKEELRSRPLLEFIHPEDRAILHRESLLSASGPLLKDRFDIRFLHQAGHYRWLQWSMRSDQEQKLIFVSARDVTETKEARTYFQVVVEAAQAGLMIVNKEGRIVLVNRQIEAQFGYQREELKGKSVETLVPERYRGGHEGSLHDFLTAPTSRSMGAGRDLFGLRADGTEFPVEIALNPFRTGETQFVLCTVVDITSRKTQELELKNRVEELQHHRAEMDTLSQMSSLLQHAVDPDEVHAIVAGYSAQLFHGAKVAIYNLPPSANYLRLSTSWGGYEGPEVLRSNDCWALRRSRTHHCSKTNIPVCPHTDSASLQYSICIPMAAHGQLIGLVTIAADLKDHDEMVVQLDRLGKSVADQLALALSNLGLRRQLENHSMRDSLTDLYNRRFLEESVPREMERSIRKKKKLSVLMIDADHFKIFNDTHGHQAGDEVLRTIGKIFKLQTRPTDICCRYGGEEFLILLPDCSKEEAAERANHLRASVWEESKGKVSISTGVAEYPYHGVEWASLLQAADHALYSAKAGGRNKVVVAARSLPQNPKVENLPHAIIEEESILTNF